MTWKPDYLLWLDLETTGSEVDGDDCIIEIGCVLTDWELNDILYTPGVGVGMGTPWEFSKLVDPTQGGIVSLFFNKVVWNMHTRNGLIEELQREGADGSYHVEEKLLRELEMLGVRPHKAALAGSGVGHFDIRALRRWMPALVKFLAYPIFDIGVVRRSFQWWVRDEFKDSYLYETKDGKNFGDLKPHRALQDAKLHLEEARWFRNIIHDLDPEV